MRGWGHAGLRDRMRYNSVIIAYFSIREHVGYQYRYDPIEGIDRTIEVMRCHPFDQPRTSTAALPMSNGNGMMVVHRIAPECSRMAFLVINGPEFSDQWIVSSTLAGRRLSHACEPNWALRGSVDPTGNQNRPIVVWSVAICLEVVVARLRSHKNYGLFFVSHWMARE